MKKLLTCFAMVIFSTVCFSQSEVQNISTNQNIQGELDTLFKKIDKLPYSDLKKGFESYRYKVRVDPTPYNEEVFKYFRMKLSEAEENQK